MGDLCCLWFPLGKFGDERGELGFQFGDAVGIGLLGRLGLVRHGDEILVRHLCVAEDLASVLAGDGGEVVGASPDEAVVIGEGHGN